MTSHDDGARSAHRHAGHAAPLRSAAEVRRLEVEGEVLSAFVDAVVDRLEDEIGPALRNVRRVVDLGSGPGVATCDLAARFPSASVVAVDSSEPMLARVAERASRLGCGDRVTTLEVDLDGDLGAVGPCDLVFASMALHHVSDEVSSLAQVRSLVEPAGHVCVLERADQPVVRLASEAGRPGIWERLDAAQRAWFEVRRRELPGAARADQYPAMLDAAGLDVVVDETVELTIGLHAGSDALQYAKAQLERLLGSLTGYAEPDDLAALAQLVPTMGEAAATLGVGTLVATRQLLIGTPPAQAGRSAGK